MLKPSTKEKLSITIKNILMDISDGPFRGLPYLPNQRKRAWSYIKFGNPDRQRYARRLYYLKQRGWVVDVVRGKEHYLELSGRGREKLTKLVADGELVKPSRWDKKWRIVMFDIEQKERSRRDRLRRQLTSWGFIPIQESVYVYPFECKIPLDQFRTVNKLKGSIIYMIANIIEGEEAVIDRFIDNGVLTKEHVS